MLPLSLLKTSQGHPVLIELKNGETFNGHMVLCDTWMNIHLREVICTSKDGDRFFRMPEAFIRGNTIKYIRVPEEVIDKVKDEKISRDEKRPQSGGRGGRGPGGRGWIGGEGGGGEGDGGRGRGGDGGGRGGRGGGRGGEGGYGRGPGGGGGRGGGRDGGGGRSNGGMKEEGASDRGGRGGGRGYGRGRGE